MLMLRPATDRVAIPDVRTEWFVRTRWGAFAGQVLIILAARPIFGIELPVGVLLAIAGTMGVTNLALAWVLRQQRRVSRAWCGIIVAFDTLELTALLFISGGTSNPFSVFYLVQITMAAVTLGSRWTWALAVLGVSSYASLFLVRSADTAASAVHAAHLFAQHLVAMWVALTLSAALTAYFVTRLTAVLAEREAEIASMRDAATRRERLAALTTLAAGAAHELGSPLATVAVAAGELEHALAKLPSPEAGAIGDDVRLIRSEVRRCRDILDGMAAESGDAAGEMPSAFTTVDLVHDIRAGILSEDRARVETREPAGPAPLFLPRRAVVRAAGSLVRNALDASHASSIVTLELHGDDRLRVRVGDAGPGMAPDVLARAGEPFFTTKPPGQGLGLGLFLVRSLADHLGGQFRIESSAGKGTTAVLELPARIEVYAGHNWSSPLASRRGRRSRPQPAARIGAERCGLCGRYRL